MAAFGPGVPELSDRDLATITRLVYERSGIALHPGKRALVTARLQKRLRRGGFESFHAYVRHLKADPTGGEAVAVLEAIATHHTAFFREPQHFTFLSDVVLPSLEARHGRGPILGWSAGCSTGEEPYTVAMTLCERLGEHARPHVRLLASDLSSRALAVAMAGAYRAERVAGLPRCLVLKYFRRSPTLAPGFVEVTDQIRRMVEFRRLNLLEPTAGQPLDFIFCRNVLMYFDRAAQQHVVDRLTSRLARGGYLFTAHSESLNTLTHDLTWIAPAVYRKRP